MLHVPKLTNKAECLIAYQEMYFGNRLKSWKTLDEFISSNPDESKLYGLMYKAPGSGKRWFRTEMPVYELLCEFQKWVTEGANPKYIQVSEALICNDIILQGEIMISHSHYDLTCTTEKGQPNRPQLWKNKQVLTGVTALSYLKTFLWEKSYDMIMECFETWPNAVVEFSAVGYEVGILPGHNTVIWEIREY